jgi:hypothetical protein
MTRMRSVQQEVKDPLGLSCCLCKASGNTRRPMFHIKYLL